MDGREDEKRKRGERKQEMLEEGSKEGTEKYAGWGKGPERSTASMNLLSE